MARILTQYWLVPVTAACFAAPAIASQSPSLSDHLVQIDETPEAPPAEISVDDLVDIDDPAAPLQIVFPNADRIARPTGFALVPEREADLVVFRSGRQIYLHLKASEAGVEQELADAIATFWEHETDSGLGDGIRVALTDLGASPNAAAATVDELEQLLARPYRWQALCFTLIPDGIEVIGIASAR